MTSVSPGRGCARYPNGLPGALPYEAYTQSQAEGAAAVSDDVIALARRMLPSED